MSNGKLWTLKCLEISLALFCIWDILGSCKLLYKTCCLILYHIVTLLICESPYYLCKLAAALLGLEKRTRVYLGSSVSKAGALSLSTGAPPIQ